MHQAKSLVWLREPHLTYLLPWRLVEWEMAGPGQSRLRPPLMMNSGETGQMKCHRSKSRRDGGWPTLPFPLQDDDRRCASVQQLYQHAGEQPKAHLDVATQGITHQYPDMEPCEAKSLSNQVLCMIAEYHLTGLTQGSSSISLVLPEVAQDLLPPIEDYLVGGEFQGLRDVRVVERAKTL